MRTIQATDVLRIYQPVRSDFHGGVAHQVRNSHNAKSHQEPDGNLTPDLDLDVPEQQDGKGGADEIGQDGEDYPDVFSTHFEQSVG